MKLLASDRYMLEKIVWRDLISELIFGKWIWTGTFQFTESGGSLNGPDLFTELPFL